ncbi:MAG: hypothetical protein U5K81_10140 [Trueperaceae bacterium]|nr:hypothetical protein [Trueperaceae bacterium]
MGKGTWRWLLGVVLAALMSVGQATGDGPMLMLDTGTLEADLGGTTLHASEVTGAHVGQIDEELFVAIVVDEATRSDEARSVRGYVCNREVGVWLDGEVNGNEVTLSSDDGVIQLEARIGTRRRVRRSRPPRRGRVAPVHGDVRDGRRGPVPRRGAGRGRGPDGGVGWRAWRTAGSAEAWTAKGDDPL